MSQNNSSFKPRNTRTYTIEEVRHLFSNGQNLVDLFKSLTANPWQKDDKSEYEYPTTTKPPPLRKPQNNLSSTYTGGSAASCSSSGDHHRVNNTKRVKFASATTVLSKKNTNKQEQTRRCKSCQSTLSSSTQKPPTTSSSQNSPMKSILKNRRIFTNTTPSALAASAAGASANSPSSLVKRVPSNFPLAGVAYLDRTKTSKFLNDLKQMYTRIPKTEENREKSIPDLQNLYKTDRNASKTLNMSQENYINRTPTNNYSSGYQGFQGSSTSRPNNNYNFKRNISQRNRQKGGIAAASSSSSEGILEEKLNEDSNASSEAAATNAGPSTSNPATTSDDDKDKEQDDKDAKKKKNRCAECRKKVGLTGFECRCGGLYCAIHRYSDKHDCTFNYREHGAQEIRRNNPVVVGEKIQKI